MKLFRSLAIVAVTLCAGAVCIAQVESGGGVSRRSGNERRRPGQKAEEQSAPEITERMQDFFDTREPHDADLEWMRVIYRQIDLSKDENAPLYFPEDVVDGQENLFRIILRLVVDGKVPAYEYLDGRELFTDKYKINVPEMLDRFGIYYTTEGSGRNGSNIKIEEADVPTGQVLNYYIIERWEFDKRSNQMKVRVEAICPVLNRYGDFGGEAKYPMFWVKYDQIRPWLAGQYVFLTDDNNLATYSIDDYFNLGLYQGDIYKTKNLRNLSMNQLHPDPDDLKAAQDSIERRLRAFGDNLWVPDRDEYLAQKAAAEAAQMAAAESEDSIAERSVAPAATSEPKRSTRAKKSTTKKPKAPKLSNSSSSDNSSAAKSVRRRKK